MKVLLLLVFFETSDSLWNTSFPVTDYAVGLYDENSGYRSSVVLNRKRH